MRKRASHFVESALWIAALSLVTAGAAQVLARQTTRVEPVSTAQHASVAQASDAQIDATPDLITGRLECAAIHLSVPIVRDYDGRSLVKGVGHIPGSALPGGLGNLVLAGHRDTFFRPLSRITPGMTMDIFNKGGHFRYIVDATEIVDPSAVRVLQIGERPEMTLITCYPFTFVGAAPQRFIVHTHLEL